MFLTGKDYFMYKINKAKDFIIKVALSAMTVFIMIALFVVSN